MTLESVDSRGVDRRRTARVPLQRRVRLRFDAPSVVVEAETCDLSTGGMFVRTSCFRQPGDRFDFEIHLSDGGDVIAGTAEIVRLRGGDSDRGPSGMGVHFLELSGQSAERMKRLLSVRHVAQRSDSGSMRE